MELERFVPATASVKSVGVLLLGFGIGYMTAADLYRVEESIPTPPLLVLALGFLLLAYAGHRER